jgi:tRNA dimethylallyltransferase
MSSLESSSPEHLAGSSGTGPPLVVIIGPTAVGKTEISVQLAERLGGEIISADSRLFYRGMNIGTAKPSATDRIRVPHHLIDVADPSEIWSLAVFQKAAAKSIEEIHSRNRLPFLVGGTGQYIHAVRHGWSPPATAPDFGLRSELEAQVESIGYQGLYNRLLNLDPIAAGNIDPRNVRRTIRALEVIQITGRKFSEQRRQAGGHYRLLTIGLTRPRPELYARIDARIESMFSAGFLEEVNSLLGKNYLPDLPTMSAIGYRECVAVLEGRMSLEEAKVQMQKLTRVFVRRQANWFKEDDPQINWFPAGQTDPRNIEERIRLFLEET